MLCIIGLILLAQPASEEALFSALKSGRYAEGLRLVEPLIEAEPRNARLWTARGLAYQGLGRTKEALEAFEAALRISPRLLPALEGAAEIAYRAHDPRTVGFLRTILELRPGNETAHAMSAVVAFETKDCSGAVSHFEKCRNAIASNHVALSQFGFCLLETGQPQRSTEEFTRALALDPSNAATRFNLGLAQHLAGQNAAAISTLEPLVVRSDFDANVLSLLAAAYAATERVRDAIEALRRATQMAPRDERHYFDLAVLCMEHQAPLLALEMVAVGLSNIPDSALLHTMRGTIYATLSRFEEAKADFEAAERLMPEELYGSVGLSLLFRQANEIDQSIATLRDKLRQEPEDPTLNFLLADALLRKQSELDSGALAEVRAALLRSVRAKPDFAKAHAQLGKVYLRDGETERAIAELRLALKFDPDDRVALHQLSMALHSQGHAEEARELAVRLKNLIRQEQVDETKRNRFLLLKAPPNR